MFLFLIDVFSVDTAQSEKNLSLLESESGKVVKPGTSRILRSHNVDEGPPIKKERVDDMPKMYV